MMIWIKDRYTYFLIASFFYAMVLMYAIHKGSTDLIAASLIIGVIHAIASIKQKARLHIEEGFSGNLKTKEEGGCEFEDTIHRYIDSVCIGGKQYKTRGGTDLYVTKGGTVKPCGIGSYLVNLTGGGWEAKSIQKN